MPHLILELVLWILLAFFIGCIIGCILHKIFAGGETAALQTSPSESKPTPSVDSAITGPAAAPILTGEPVPPPVAEPPSPGRPERPKGIAAARDGKPDNLQRISGIGPKNERTLHNLGFFHFDQIAAWRAEEVDWIDDHLKFEGRITREEWIAQARLLAEGNEEEFERRYGIARTKS